MSDSSFGREQYVIYCSQLRATPSADCNISHITLGLSNYLILIIWLVPRAGKMNQIARCDWLPERARWSHLARLGLPAVSRKQNFPKSHIINPLLTKFVRSRWLDIGLVLFLRVYGPRLRLGPKTRKKKNLANIQPS